MRLGAHQSIAGGIWHAIEAARRDGCEALQIFTRNQSQWRAKPLADQAVARFREAVAEWGLPRERILAHDSYLINVAARDPALRRRSQAALVLELRRCARLGIPNLVVHPGAHMGQGEAPGLALVAAAVSAALEETADEREPPLVLFENTAGQGTTLGWRFEHLRDLLGEVHPRDRVGVCLDTQHAFAAGYDLASEEGCAATLAAADRAFGLERVRGFHLNDSKCPRGGRVDRHERIGRGKLGRPCFRVLLADARFAELPGVLELPPPYPPQLAGLRRLADGRATARRRPRAGAYNGEP
jgi:deoxyribonuclease-4